MQYKLLNIMDQNSTLYLVEIGWLFVPLSVFPPELYPVIYPD